MFGDLFPINQHHGNLSASRGPVSPKDLTMSQAQTRWVGEGNLPSPPEIKA